MQKDYKAQIMSSDTIVAEVRGDSIIVVNEALLPLYLKKFASLEAWLATREIDLHRTNSRLLRKALRITNTNDAELVLSVYAASITDSYWVRPEGSALCYADVRFRENYFADLALRGSVDDFTKASILFDTSEEKRTLAHTPELTNTGSFEKCWKNLDGAWWLYKRGDILTIFSELFVYQLGKKLGFPMAQYEQVDDTTLRSLDYTNGARVNFEPAAALVGEDEDYIVNYKLFQSMRQDLADQYLQIIMLDGFCQNVDRHTNNYGVLRDAHTGEILSMAPNYDNNLALVANKYPDNPKVTSRLQSDLTELEQATGAFISYAKRHKMPVITPALIKSCIAEIGIPVETDLIVDFVMYRYQNTPTHALAQKEMADKTQER